MPIDRSDIVHMKLQRSGDAEGLSIKEQPEPEPQTCETCNGTGKEICDNPDHRFIVAVGGEVGRLGCPCCGHDEDHAIPGTVCGDCNGTGEVNQQPQGFKEWRESLPEDEEHYIDKYIATDRGYKAGYREASAQYAKLVEWAKREVEHGQHGEIIDILRELEGK
jgi:hypothetical protein